LMKRVDIFGPPGSGKTTILKSVMRSENRKGNWYTDKEFIPEADYNLFKKKKFDLFDVIKYTAFKVFKKKSLLPICWEQREYFFSKSLLKYKKLIGQVNKSFIQDPHATPEIKAYRIEWFKDVLEKIVLLERIKKDGVIFFEESLTYRYFESVGDFYSVEEHIEMIKENGFPVADSCICISENIDTLMERLANRDKVTRAHKQMTKGQIELHVRKSIRCTEKALKVLGSMNIPILKVGEGDSVSNSTMKINHFIANVTVD